MSAPRFTRLAALCLFAMLSTLPLARAQAPDTGEASAPSGLSVDPKTTAQIYSVDGGRLRGPLTNTGSGAREAMLQPGPHVLAGHVVTGSGLSPYRIRVDFEPGKRYVLHAAVRGYSVRVRVVERGAPRPSFGPPAATPDCQGGTPGCGGVAAATATADATQDPAGATPANQEATLDLRLSDGVVANFIDGKSAIAGGFWKTVYPRDFTLAPGKHRIDMQFTDASSGQPMVGFSHLWFVAAPGGRYFVKKESDGAYFSIWIEDADGRRVGGIAGSEDEPGG